MPSMKAIKNALLAKYQVSVVEIPSWMFNIVARDQRTINRTIVGNCRGECFHYIREECMIKRRRRHRGGKVEMEMLLILQICFFIYIVLVGYHDVFHFRDRLSMNYEFIEDNGWVGIYRNDQFQNWFKG